MADIDKKTELVWDLKKNNLQKQWYTQHKTGQMGRGKQFF